MRFDRAETAAPSFGTPQAADWTAISLPARWPSRAGPRWVRVRFDAARLPTGGTALFGERIRERFTVELNGIDLHRSNADESDRSFDWHRPLFMILPERLLRPHGNVILFRISADAGRATAFSPLVIGPDRELRAFSRARQFVTVTAPEIITWVIALLSLGSMLFWLVRPQEQVFGWLVLLGACWSFWNLQYFVEGVPFDDALFWTLNADTPFPLTWAAFALAATLIGVPRRGRFILGSAAVSAFGIVFRHVSLAFGWSPLPSYMLELPLAIGTVWVLGSAYRREPRIEKVLMIGAMTVSIAFGFHDLAYLGAGFAGLGFQLQPFGGLLVYLAFGFALGRRVLVALATVEDVNLILAERVQEATDQLQRSENERRRLEVARAVDGERERIMREIHDGIGSSLITALAVAQRDTQSASTIATLKRSIQDLRVGIDSLEPVHGDVVMLLANLRHRVERDLGEAGLVFVWRTMSAPLLPWLDPIGALHILRILQEAVSNILKHAAATVIKVDCTGAERHGRAGVLVTIADNGRGFVPGAAEGRGLRNMAARAEALNARFGCESVVGKGTTLRLWLPLAPPVQRHPASPRR